MRMAKWMVAVSVLTLTLASCVKKNSDSEPAVKPIPEALVFDKNELPAITEEEFQASVLFLNQFFEVKNLGYQVMTDDVLDNYEKRRQDLMEMTNAQQIRVDELFLNCVQNPFASAPIDYNKLRPGQTLSEFGGNKVTSNSNCVLEAERRQDLAYTLLSVVPGKSAELNLGATVTDSSVLLTQADQDMFGYSSIRNTLTGYVRYHGTLDGSSSSSYEETSRTGMYEGLKNGIGNVKNVTFSRLLYKADNSESYIVKSTFETGGHTILFTLHEEIDSAGKSFREAFVGNRPVADSPQFSYSRFKAQARFPSTF